MSNESPSEPPQDSGRHMPPPVPGFHAPPPIPQLVEPFSVPAAPESTGAVRQAEAVGVDRKKSGSGETVSFVLERSQRETLERSSDRPPGVFLPSLVIVLAILSGPCILVASMAPPGAKWPGLAWGLMLSLLATCFGRFAKNRSGKPHALSQLSFQLAVGFFVISFLAVIAALIQDVTALKRWTEGIEQLWRKSYEMVASIKVFVFDLFRHSSSATGAGTPVPSATPTPAP